MWNSKANLARNKVLGALCFSVVAHLAFLFVLSYHRETPKKPLQEAVRVNLLNPQERVATVSPLQTPKNQVPKAQSRRHLSSTMPRQTQSKNQLLKANMDLTANLTPREGGFADEGQSRANEQKWNLKAASNAEQMLERSSWRAKVRRDGRVAFEDRWAVPRIKIDSNGLKLSLSFDITEILMKIRGEALDAPQKKKFLEETRADREEMARDVADEKLTHALFDIRSHLVAIWEGKGRSIAEKKKLLFALWDECAETDSDVQKGVATLVRMSIVAFIARELPIDSEYAFSDEELAVLNHSRHSRAMFEPYASTAG